MVTENTLRTCQEKQVFLENSFQICLSIETNAFNRSDYRFHLIRAVELPSDKSTVILLFYSNSNTEEMIKKYLNMFK